MTVQNTRFKACFECGKAWPIKAKYRHAPKCDDSEHKHYWYNRKKLPDELDVERPKVKGFEARAYESKMILPLNQLDILQELEIGEWQHFETPHGSWKPGHVQITGVVRYWDRLEVHYQSEIFSAKAEEKAMRAEV